MQCGHCNRGNIVRNAIPSGLHFNRLPDCLREVQQDARPHVCKPMHDFIGCPFIGFAWQIEISFYASSMSSRKQPSQLRCVDKHPPLYYLVSVFSSTPRDVLVSCLQAAPSTCSRFGGDRMRPHLDFSYMSTTPSGSHVVS